MRAFLEKPIACALACALVCACMPLSARAASAQQEEGSDASIVDVPADESSYVPGELLVTFEDEVAVSDEAAEAAAEGIVSMSPAVDSAEVVSADSEQAGAVARVRLESDADLSSVEQELARVPGVASIQPNFVYKDLTSQINGYKVSDSLADQQYYLDSYAQSGGANVRAAWSKVRNGASAADAKTTIAVLDSGFLFAHEDLNGNLLQSLACDVSSGRARKIGTQLQYNMNHGTHVAGILGAHAGNGKGIAGVSYNAKVLPVKVFDWQGACTTAMLVVAYKYLFGLVDTGQVRNLRVVNMSLGSYDADDRNLERIITTARDDYGIVTVCAGGNGNEGDSKTARTDRLVPSDLDACVSVTALEKDGTNAAWSDYNACKDISAPGVDILSTWGNGGYASETGTSMAAPIVAGALSLLWAKDPGLSVDQALKALYATATPVNGSRNSRAGVSGSHGCIDAAAALDYLDNYVSVSAAKCSVGKQAWTGKEVKPAPTVKLGTKVLVRNKDYKFLYKNNVDPGTATIVVAGMGAYTGSITKTFKIVLPDKVTKVQKAKVKSFKFKALSGRKVRATYGKVAKATGYQIAYANAKDFKWVKKKTKKLKWTSAKFKKGAVYMCTVRPYVKYKGKCFYGKWSATRLVVVRK